MHVMTFVVEICSKYNEGRAKAIGTSSRRTNLGLLTFTATQGDCKGECGGAAVPKLIPVDTGCKKLHAS